MADAFPPPRLGRVDGPGRLSHLLMAQTQGVAQLGDVELASGVAAFEGDNAPTDSRAAAVLSVADAVSLLRCR